MNLGVPEIFKGHAGVQPVSLSTAPRSRAHWYVPKAVHPNHPNVGPRLEFPPAIHSRFLAPQPNAPGTKTIHSITYWRKDREMKMMKIDEDHEHHDHDDEEQDD